mmetsp:Transcript_44710/g.142669  ORF Transcript_44710/g.142669 Transcript_44710/m.142669 type:complete len:278 (+) Transcript_44710:3012-3845(+)
MPAPALRAAQLEESFFKCMATNVTSNRNTKKMAPTLTKAITSMKKVTTILMALALRPLSFFFSFLLPALLPGDTSGLFLSPSCHAFFCPSGNLLLGGQLFILNHLRLWDPGAVQCTLRHQHHQHDDGHADGPHEGEAGHEVGYCGGEGGPRQRLAKPRRAPPQRAALAGRREAGDKGLEEEPTADRVHRKCGQRQKTRDHQTTEKEQRVVLDHFDLLRQPNFFDGLEVEDAVAEAQKHQPCDIPYPSRLHADEHANAGQSLAAFRLALAPVPEPRDR